MSRLATRICRHQNHSEKQIALQVHGQLFTSQWSAAESDSITDGISYIGLLNFLLPCQQPRTPLLHSWLSPLPRTTRIRLSGARWGSERATGTDVWVAVPWDSRRKGEEKEEGGRALKMPGERDLPANWVKHCVIQASVMGEVGKRAKGWKGGGDAWAACGL